MISSTRFARIFSILSAFLLLALPLSAQAATATLYGHVFLDDDGDYMYDVSTDSNGVKDPGEDGLDGHSIHIVDEVTLNLILTVATDPSGDWEAEVDTGDSLLVFVKLSDFNAAPDFIITTDSAHVVDPDPNEELEIPDFGYGPIGPF